MRLDENGMFLYSVWQSIQNRSASLIHRKGHEMAYITFYFQIHQPRRLHEVDPIDLGLNYHEDLEKT